MASVIDGELMTIAEAAERLKVSKVTISRWIKQGRLRAYHVGPRVIRLRQDDVDRLVEPAEPTTRPRLQVRIGDRVYDDISEVPPMTDEEKEEILAWARRLEERRARIAARRNGEPFPDSTEIIREMRLERAEHLGNPENRK